ncbi:hypothetical protein DAEQUDRAFT_214484 [Daedalea quercina L-15889]|uniref:YCII-related domain-containing protein n=1 Tax=Daedalea quercina L-15889 TaxID=1314783 RepID=A0A165R389_9APHY|nr:hypothetical protein DAEQUDRAFT_214484 [Daedalea quercina L-15889]
MSVTHHFVLWAPYSTCPGTIELWASTRSIHKAKLDPLIASGVVTFGGPVLSPRADLSAPFSEQEMYGSMLIYQGDSVESVRKLVEADPFYTEGVWDKEKLQLHPMRPVV